MNVRRNEFNGEDSPLARAALERHPEMWPQIHSSVPRGWDAEVAGALEAIAELADETGVTIRVAQIKSKFAELRVYLDVDERSAGAWEAVNETPDHTRLRSSSAPGSVRERATAIVDAASKRCESRCERCGAPGVLLNNGGWLRVACTAHARTASRWRTSE